MVSPVVVAVVIYMIAQYLQMPERLVPGIAARHPDGYDLELSGSAVRRFIPRTA